MNFGFHAFSFAFPTTPAGIVVYVIGLLILWVVVSVPVYFAAKAITWGRSDFGDAMGATLGGALGYFIVLYGVSYFLGAVIGNSAGVLGLILALFVWLAVYRAAFRTSWIRAVGIVALSWLILVVLDYFLVQGFGVTFPNFLPFG